MKRKYRLSFQNLFFLFCITNILFLNISCSELLEEEPKSLVVETFYNTDEEIETAVNAIYVPNRHSFTYYASILEVHTDYCYGRGSNSQMNDWEGLNDANRSKASSFWTSFYLGIRNANSVILNASRIQTEKSSQYIGEAKFLRALFYFQLVRSFGGVCIKTEENMDEVDCPRSTTDEVYDLIISDLQDAEISLPSEQDDIGRPTEWSAKTLLSDVYLQLGEYQKAMDKANEVISSNQFSLVEITSKEGFQKDVWGPDLLETSEEIFFLKYTRQDGYGNYLLWHINHIATGVYPFGGAYGIYSKDDNPFYTSWDDNDFRKQLWELVDFGLGSNTLVITKFGDPDAVSIQGGGNDYPIYSYSDVLLIYAEAANHVAEGPTAEAVEAINKVHRRAYGENPNVSSSIDFKATDYDIDSFLDLVLRERAYEFQFVGKRWFDLKRTGKLKETILETKGITVAEKHMLWPIPDNEFNYNDAIDPSTDQNPGY